MLQRAPALAFWLHVYNSNHQPVLQGPSLLDQSFYRMLFNFHTDSESDSDLLES